MEYELRVRSFDLARDIGEKLGKKVDKSNCDDSGVYPIIPLDGKDFGRVADLVDLNPGFCELFFQFPFSDDVFHRYNILEGTELNGDRSRIIGSIIGKDRFGGYQNGL